MKATLNKIFSVLLAVCFVLSAIPAPAAAAEIPTSSTTNGYYNGNDWVEGGNGSTTHTIEGTEVSLSKTAVPVAGMENTFDITLQVKTSTTTSVETASGAVVLVIDTSGSMAYCSECGTDFIHDWRCPYFISSFWGDDVTRLDAAQDAAYTFLQTYAGTDANASRMLAIVSFASGSEIKLNWVNVAGGAGKNSFDAAVNAIYGLRANGGTNLDAGLKKAHDLMQQSAVVGIESKSVVALTDGAPTQSLTAGNGTSGSDTINTHTKAQAGNVKSLATLYTIGFGVANQTTHSGGPTVNAFLAEVASTGKAYTAENRSELFGAFAAITQDITSGLTGEGWTATDPMAEMITVTGGTGANFSGVDGTYTWKLSNPETVTEGSTTKYVYSHTYRVTLNVQDENFKEGQFFPTNKPTYLNVGDAQYAFPVPGVTGVLPRTDVTVTKVWKDAENQDGKRTESVTVQLKQGENLIGEKVTLDASNNWTYTWDGETYNLISHINNQPIAYTVVEDEVADYTPAVTSAEENPFALTLTNTHEIEKTSVTVTKKWDDNNNQDGIRPGSIEVELLANDESTGQTATLNNDNEWKYEFTDLDKYAAGKEIVYTARETKVPEGYTSSEPGLTITNTHTPEMITISGKKTWNDNDNQDGIRPESISITLKADGEVVTTKTVTKADDWKWSFENQPKFRDGGVEIVYTITEDTVDGYTPVVEGYNVTNTHAPEKTSVKVTKAWSDNNNQDGIRPSSVTIHLKADNADTGKTLTLSASGNWTGSFTDLDKYADGDEIEYTVYEDAVSGYDLQSISGDAETGFTITNAHQIEKTSVSVTKVWNDNDDQDGKRPQSVTIELWVDDVNTGKTLTLTESDNWTGAFTELDKYAEGKEIAYTVAEQLAEDSVYMQTGITGNAKDGFAITNSYTPETTTVSGSKTWDDADDQDGKRPESITINLTVNNEVIDSKTVTADEDGNWTYSFEDLPKYSNGKLITYGISEDKVEGYTTDVNDFDVINTYTPEKTSITVTKVWKDDDNRDGLRPNDITVVVKNGNKTVGELILNNGNKWTETLTDLDKYNGGKEIVYTVEEVTVTGYDVEITGDAKEGFTITNTHEPEMVTISGTKTWDDGNNQDRTRPEAITVKLMDNGTEVQSTEVKPDANGKWTWTFTAPKYNKGVEIPYTVEEVVPEGYNATYPEGTYDIENFYSPETINIKVTKAWIDGDNQDGLRPEEIVVKLTADLTDFEATLKLNEDNKWTASFEELDKNFDGKEITYTLEEVTKVEGYNEPVIEGDHKTGFTVKNIHEPEVTEVIGKKTWNDANNQDGKRPESITVKLLANGQVVDTQVVSEKESWIYSFENLPKFEAGEQIIYTVVENEVRGYSATYSKDNYNITNSYTPETMNIKVTKSWVDSNDADGIRPTKVTIYLLANGEKTGDKLILTAGDKWTGSFTDLPMYEDGKAIKYTIEEKAVKDYKAVIKGTAEDGFTVTNSHTTIPKTGDERTPILWISMMALGIIAVFFATRPFFVKKGKYSR